MVKKAVVTGGAGFIGSNLVDELIKKNYQVDVIDDLSSGKKENINPKANFHNYDITVLEQEKLISLLESADYVFHLAALPRVQETIDNPLKAHRINVVATLNLLFAAHKSKIKKFIFASSCSVYGDSDLIPYNVETTPLNPKSPYALQKIIGEKYCKLFNDDKPYGLPCISLRFFNVYGPRMNPDGAYALVVGIFLKQIKNKQPLTITGDGNQTRDFVHVSDVVNALVLAAEIENINGEVFNIGSAKESSVNYIADLIGGEKVYIPARYEPRRALAEISKTNKLLKWEPKITIEEGIKELKQLYLH